jgi:hypothetical protein
MFVILVFFVFMFAAGLLKLIGFRLFDHFFKG